MLACQQHVSPTESHGADVFLYANPEVRVTLVPLAKSPQDYSIAFWLTAKKKLFVKHKFMILVHSNMIIIVMIIYYVVEQNQKNHLSLC